MLTARRGETRTLRDWASYFDGTSSPARGLLLAAIWHGALEVDLGRRLEFESVAVCTGRVWG